MTTYARATSSGGWVAYDDASTVSRAKGYCWYSIKAAATSYLLLLIEHHLKQQGIM